MLADPFWLQFTKNYLPNLQHRQKWISSTVDLTPDQVVMIIDPQLPRALWPVGRVTKVIPSDDGQIHTEININGSTYTWPVAKLIPLPEMPEDPRLIIQDSRDLCDNANTSCIFGGRLCKLPCSAVLGRSLKSPEGPE